MIVYKIQNKINNKVYIGSTSTYKSRISIHKYNLNKNKHYNWRLQEDWNKYGKDNFVFSIIEEEIKVKDIEKLETIYISKYENNIYNLEKKSKKSRITKECVLQVSPLTCEIINIFNSSSKVEEFFNNETRWISPSIRRKSKTYGYYWCYKSQYNEFYKWFIKNSKFYVYYNHVGQMIYFNNLNEEKYKNFRCIHTTLDKIPFSIEWNDIIYEIKNNVIIGFYEKQRYLIEKLKVSESRVSQIISNKKPLKNGYMYLKNTDIKKYLEVNNYKELIIKL